MSALARRLKAIARRSDARLLRVAATAGASYLGRFGSGIAVLVTLPMARQALDPELFGIWMMLSALLGFMAFADFGIGNGVLNKTTAAKASGNPELLRRTVVSGYVCTSAVGLLLLAAWFAWSRTSADPTIVAGNIDPVHRAEVMQALDVFACVLALNVPASLIQRVQLGMQQGYWNGVAQFASALTTLVAVPVTLREGGGVAALVLATLGVQAAVNIANTAIWLYKHDILRVALRGRAVDGVTMIALLRTGSLFFVLQMAAAFAYQSDAIVITHTLGQRAYGDFAVVQKLFLFVSMLLSAVTVALWPAFGDAIASNNMVWVGKVLKRSIGAAAGLAFVATALLGIAMPWIMAHWLKTTYRPSAELVLAFSVWTMIDAISGVTSAFMNGANILRAQVLFALAMAGTAFAAKWLLTPTLGAAGAVLATILAYCLISVPGQIYIFKRVFKPKD